MTGLGRSTRLLLIARLVCAAALCLAASAGAPVIAQAASPPAPSGTPAPTSPMGTPAVELPDKTAPEALKGDEEATIAALTLAVSQRPLDAEAQYQLGRALRRAKRRAESVEHFEKAVQIGPATAARLLDLGVAYSDVSRFSEAEATYARLLAMLPGNADALFNTANVSVRRGDFDRAIEYYQKAIASDPTLLHAYYHLGHTLKFTGRHREAYAAYEKVLTLQPADEREQKARIDSLYQIASIDLAAGDYARAERRFLEVTKIAPNHNGAHWGRAQALLRLGRTEEAKKEIETHARLLGQRPPTGPSAMAP